MSAGAIDEEAPLSPTGANFMTVCCADRETRTAKIDQPFLTGQSWTNASHSIADPLPASACSIWCGIALYPGLSLK